MTTNRAAVRPGPFVASPPPRERRPVDVPPSPPVRRRAGLRAPLAAASRTPWCWPCRPAPGTPPSRDWSARRTRTITSGRRNRNNPAAQRSATEAVQRLPGPTAEPDVRLIVDDSAPAAAGQMRRLVRRSHAVWTMSQHRPLPNCSPQRSGAPAPATEVQALAAFWLGQVTVGIAKDAMRWLADALPRRGDTPASIGWWTSCGARPFGSRSISRHCCCPGWPTSAVRWPTRCCLRWRPTKMPTPNCGAMRAVCGSGSPTPRSRRGGRHTWIHRGKGVGP